ncbi:hypothetical protein DFA_11107 [Cavenderia fasciculata]|uniref:Uncharacterized protein n=1 Tax=Cavenderia fasciculata TaxID=261658 RepID=F4QET5_CACFS|nr:uncharacterized protein DFA_11107 [Cavenderia fasciculata]EGG13346.1 hypothetical protein DFA_11107 [Cavenderia fasciculata]|eukprot:XP_004350050.1 hypothetical protein DFA_11107 [Cavenderia fasciculata]
MNTIDYEPIRFKFDFSSIQGNNDQGYRCMQVGDVVTILNADNYPKPYTCLPSDIPSQQMKNNAQLPAFLTSIQQYFQRVISIPHASANLLALNPQMPSCYNYPIPSSYISSGAGVPIPNADVVVFVTMRPKLDDTVFASAAPCNYFSNGNTKQRPLAIFVQLTPLKWNDFVFTGTFPPSVTPNTLARRAYYALIHEIIHGLGFFTSYLAPKVKQITELVPWSQGNGVTFEDRPMGIVDEFCLLQAIKHFKCDSVKLIEFSDPAHLSARAYGNEIMTPLSHVSPVLSVITLTILDSLGFYYIHYDAAEPLLWGKDKGCDFVYSCGAKERKTGWKDYFCVDMSKSSCSPDRLGRGVCNLKNYGNARLPLERRPFPPTMKLLTRFAGLEFFSYCPFNEAKDDFCFDTTDGKTKLAGEVFGETSKCYKMKTGGVVQSACYQEQCDTARGVLQVKTAKMTSFQDCPPNTAIFVMDGSTTIEITCPPNYCPAPKFGCTNLPVQSPSIQVTTTTTTQPICPSETTVEIIDFPVPTNPLTFRRFGMLPAETVGSGSPLQNFEIGTYFQWNSCQYIAKAGNESAFYSSPCNLYPSDTLRLQSSSICLTNDPWCEFFFGGPTYLTLPSEEPAIIVQDSTGRMLWGRFAPSATQFDDVRSLKLYRGNFLQRGESLAVGLNRYLTNGEQYLILASTGELKLCSGGPCVDFDHPVLWTSAGEGTRNTAVQGPYTLNFQIDHNICVKGANGQAFWCMMVNQLNGEYFGVAQKGYFPASTYAIVISTYMQTVWARYDNLPNIPVWNFRNEGPIYGNWIDLQGADPIVPGKSISNGFQTLLFGTDGHLELFTTFGFVRTSVWKDTITIPSTSTGSFSWKLCPQSGTLTCLYRGSTSLGEVFEGRFLVLLTGTAMARPKTEFLMVVFKADWVNIVGGYMSIPNSNYNNYVGPAPKPSNPSSEGIKTNIISNSLMTASLVSGDLKFTQNKDSVVLWQLPTGTPLTGVNAAFSSNNIIQNTFCVWDVNSYANWCADASSEAQNVPLYLVVLPSYGSVVLATSSGKIIRSIYAP